MPAQPSIPFHVMTKPIGPACNLDCTYCFYLSKESLYPQVRSWRMSDQVLEEYIRQYIESQPGPEVTFAWQGGEPTLLGVDFFRKAVALQQQYAAGKTIFNSIQTNGTLLDDQWCHFLAEHKFLVGLSIDGPRRLHDQFRLDKHQRPTFDRVMAGLQCLKKHGVQFNTLTVVHRTNADAPLEVYRFLKQIGSTFIQLIPIVERDAAGNVQPWSVRPQQYGQFLISIFDEWVRRDVGRFFVQPFDVALECWAGQGSSLCIFAPRCGRAVAMEHNGDVYSCDHFVDPPYELGNLLETPLPQIIDSPQQTKFGNDKLDTLPQYCRQCPVLHACYGGCPKHRFVTTPDGQPGLNYLCPSYKRFFTHIDPCMRTMADLLRQHRPPAQIMQMLANNTSPGRNDPCPCGSGKKYKKCCGV